MSLLTVLALSVLEATRRHAQLASNSFSYIQQQELADSALRLAILQLSSPARGASRDEASYEIFGQVIPVQVGYESGRVDLNIADRDLLTAVFAGNGFDERQAAALADRILDWRDSDDAQQSQGAERLQYRQSGRAAGPRNGPFETVAELSHVLDLENIDSTLLEAFTVYSQMADVRQSVAPPVVMRALEWADKKQLAGRDWLSPEPRTSPSNTMQDLSGEAVRLQACVTTSGSSTCRRTFVRFTGNAQQPVQVFAWEALHPEHAATSTAAAGTVLR